jgi:hypothetical protein
MSNKNKILFAIYKKDEHKGNERGFSEEDAIKNYVIASGFKEFLKEGEFIKQYSAVIAIEKIHYFKSKYVTV